MNIEDKYFWYVNKTEISKLIDELLFSFTDNPIKINNLNEITFSHQRKVICRDSEISELKTALFGSPYRSAGSIIVYGYGGLGKTALVLELIDEILKDTIDSNNKHNLDFLLFFTNKEEQLDYSKTTGEILIKPLRKQIVSYEDFVTKLFSALGVETVEQLEKFKGIVVVDNIETMSDNGEKDKILKFIFQSPRTIQYVVTSREEENCEYRINLKGFDISNQGEVFLKKYVTENNIDIEFNSKELELLKASKGNTLILVLSLLRLNDRLSKIDDIIGELNSTSSSNIETVSLFMYKNTFDRILKDLNNPHTLDILNVISLYGEAADVYSISKLSGVNNITEVERICDRLSSKLVLNKIEDYYELNEFANKFVFIKLRQNSIEERELKDEIDEYRFIRRQKIRQLEDKKTNNPKLAIIMNDWKARNNADTFAIYDAFNLYSLANQLKSVKVSEKRKAIKREMYDRFSENESMSAHPYVKFQKARIHEMILNERFSDFNLQQTTTLINNCYEDVILTINIDFKYIKTTQSYASVLWFYSQFLIKQYQAYKDAAKFLDEAVKVLENLGLKSQEYKSILKLLNFCYKELARGNWNSPYSHAIREISSKLQNL